MTFYLSAACGSFIGNSRDNNEDNFFFKNKHLPKNNRGLKKPIKHSETMDDNLLFAVFDGMGGESRGEEAAYIASVVFADELKKSVELFIDGKALLNGMCISANSAICDYSSKKQIKTVGTTVAALYYSQDDVYVCNVGDSKVFLIRNGKMSQVSKDHTDERIISTMGINKKPVLLQYLGMSDREICIEPFISKGEIVADDVYIICSDGVSDCLSHAEIYEAVKASSKPEDAVKLILSEINKRDGGDNATLIIIKIIAQEGVNYDN